LKEEDLDDEIILWNPNQTTLPKSSSIGSGLNQVIGSERKQPSKQEQVPEFPMFSNQFSLFGQGFSPSPLVRGNFDESQKLPQELLVQMPSKDWNAEAKK